MAGLPGTSRVRRRIHDTDSVTFKGLEFPRDPLATTGVNLFGGLVHYGFIARVVVRSAGQTSSLGNHQDLLSIP